MESRKMRLGLKHGVTGTRVSRVWRVLANCLTLISGSRLLSFFQILTLLETPRALFLEEKTWVPFLSDFFNLYN